MSKSIAVIWSEELLRYDLGGEHPMHPVRIDLTMRLAKSLGVLDDPGVELVSPEPATSAQIERIHTARYAAAVRDAPIAPWGIGHGLGTDDNPIFWGMYEASALVAGGTLQAVQLVWRGEADHAVSIGGGHHHAMPSSAAGFCVFNDLAIAIAWLLDNGVERVAYVDTDVHHGDGVQAAFYDDPRVMTASIHQSPISLWPNTGFASELGRGDAVGTSINVSLPPGATNGDWFRAFEATIPAALRQFRPQIIITQCGCDTHHEDPLADLSLTVDGHRAIYARLRALAEELCDGKWVATGGGGYGLVRAVPRSWTHLLAEVIGTPIDLDTPIPHAWTDQLNESVLPSFMANAVGFRTPPETMGEGASVDYVPWGGEGESALDKGILQARRAFYPLLGLDPDDSRD